MIVKEQRKREGKKEDKKGRWLVNEWVDGLMDPSAFRHIQIVALLTNKIMKKNNLITVLKL